ncbi:DUF250 domain membrane protein [Fimicolochytrium jonesii]|uniref:DUF250 domain membrane protein n=1 Tax=Fimicolochytrium jonesii TaxID=1396493 RepID=UPI0022FDEFD7|nr:DUF250 domain membrane protein [Fimicolochytrium jonesii]KAI8816573.1 DUF250 domain membrane protein [Fimicolochytrium jonesii]
MSNRENPQKYSVLPPDRDHRDSESGDGRVIRETQEERALSRVPAAVFVCFWVACSSGLILYNKSVLQVFPKHILAIHSAAFPMFLTTFHLAFATCATQILYRTTNMLQGVDHTPMSPAIYVKAVLPIGLSFSISLILCNSAYMYLSVAFIQMIKSSTSVMVLVISWILGVSKPNRAVLLPVLVIVSGVFIASLGELAFSWIGIFIQFGGTFTEAVRLVLMQQLLSSYDMNPLTSLYYFAPICAVMNGVAFYIFEYPTLTSKYFAAVGAVNLVANGYVAFALNISLVLLIGKTSSLVVCLSGVGKDMILVVVSSIIWSTPFTMLQLYGYSLALGGLVWYKEPQVFVHCLSVLPRFSASHSAPRRLGRQSKSDAELDEVPLARRSTQLNDDEV